MKETIRICVSLLLIAGAVMFFLLCCGKDEKNILSNCETSAIFNPNKNYGTLIDQEGNVYKTIQIGSQTWMAENLRTTTYRNGEKIPEVTDNNTWNNLNTGAYCNYNNTKSIDTICTFGRLYNWFAVNDNRNIAPAGWHVPTYDEWLILEAYLGDTVAASKLKESGSLHWKSFSYYPDQMANNETGFTALPGGYRWIRYGGETGFFHVEIEGGWWSVTEDEDNLDNAFHATMGYNYISIGGCFCTKLDGYSIRCVKD
jgi:uncharacterized protein (TIGR02145 family)